MYATGTKITGQKGATILARGRRTTSSSASSGAPGAGPVVAVLRLDDIPILGGYSYTIRAPGLLPLSTVLDDVIVAAIRYTTDGSTPTTSSPVLPGAEARAACSSTAAGGPTCTVETEYAPSANETLSLLLCVQRTAGSGSCTLFANAAGVQIEMKVYNAGPDVGDTGTDL